MHGCSDDSCCFGYSGRKYYTKEEKIEMLSKYKNFLDKESEAVSEKIAELKE